MNKQKQRLGTDPLNWINSTTGGQQKTRTGRPAASKREITKSSQSGLPEGWTRATFIVKEDTLKKIKDLAYTERKQLKIVINEALEGFIKGKKIINREEN
jgi:hypothetical protein